ncbi:CsbD family protein [Streptomyces phyllanthi]|uniref:CsbD family protein n=1 Tax=Streptomyces phyllanthi TaxID=1803180 RepID=A0A5N8W1K4_9ACTN|nr:CsbD family protein [Streptomyces phyllanthi]MPY40045.1 CsbD family protein [Streptomyces phyllanthi]
MAGKAGKGGADKMKGKAKEMVGKVTGDRETQVEGEIDQARGEAKKTRAKARERGQEAERTTRRDRS